MLRLITICIAAICSVFLMPVTVFSQSAISSDSTFCDVVYTEPHTPPCFQGECESDKMVLIRTVVDWIGECVNRDKIYTTKLFAKLVVSQNGEVQDAHIWYTNEMTDQCKAEITEKFKKLSGFKPGMVDGQPVCSVYDFVILCIRWQ